MKHPNTDWHLVVHEGGPLAADKSLRNHYGVRVAMIQEIEKADAYLERGKEKTRITIMKSPDHSPRPWIMLHRAAGSPEYSPRAYARGVLWYGVKT